MYTDGLHQGELEVIEDESLRNHEKFLILKTEIERSENLKIQAQEAQNKQDKLKNKNFELFDAISKVNTSISHICYDLNFDKKKLQKMVRKLQKNDSRDSKLKHLERLQKEYEVQKIIYAQVTIFI